ncbi:MAG: 50S ribosomal protein L23 [Candidatus Buchananbacteria bacterium RIFCSPLOWO2_01_FULL_56_15]|uniref:Large ribosomal subunit protein uL23 n=2 Tax=Candidatus Buchananiibacteriota TaxID=1817903 RepID=A0A1G1YJF1_9BACT|nr:MAG: 50S ribosomal protein L23 [Candidatus Buchananbacteria bacterium RIFCSPHIGHO2_02_FULL_56_16]OGY54916.1 MAG: 50S ribosomal protein L23 [Candidatus Buchananbacteria bacterium RIFCSPLOWO2_01_FULL_56_15]
MAKKEPVSTKAKATTIRGTSQNAYRVLLKPLVTEKAADLGTHNQYVFMIDPRMNKIEVKKAVRTIYGINPLAVRIITMQGKAVRYGRRYGVTKSWKKAMVTLKAGDKIEVYEGV